MYIENNILYSGKPGGARKYIRKATAADYKRYEEIDTDNKDADKKSLLNTFMKGASDLKKRIIGGSKKGSIANQTGMSRGGMSRNRTGHTDYRKGGMVLNSTDNRKV